MTTQDALERAVQMLKAVMHQPPTPAVDRLIDHIAELYAALRQKDALILQQTARILDLEVRLATHTNGPAATEPS